jgi:hypothetical protein
MRGRLRPPSKCLAAPTDPEASWSSRHLCRLCASGDNVFLLLCLTRLRPKPLSIPIRSMQAAQVGPISHISTAEIVVKGEVRCGVIGDAPGPFLNPKMQPGTSGLGRLTVACGSHFEHAYQWHAAPYPCICYSRAACAADRFIQNCPSKVRPGDKPRHEPGSEAQHLLGKVYNCST